MRRAGWGLALLGGLAMLVRGQPARAESWEVTMESGAEADSNVRRVEHAAQPRVAAPVGRAGGRVDRRGRVLGGAYAVQASGLARLVASDRARDENVMLYAGDARWLRPVGAQTLAAGIGVTAADAIALRGDRGARTFRNLGVDALFALASGDDRHLTLTVGGRDFRYKPDPSFAWRGPVATARLDLALWHGDGRVRSLELAATLGYEHRAFHSYANGDICPSTITPSPECQVATTLRHRDRYQRASLELEWVGDLVAALGYQLTVVDSNSYGQSLVRHRVSASATAELAPRLFATATATLQLDQYPDGLLVESDAQRVELVNLEDESRSSLQLRVARALSRRWTLEGRAALWRNLGNAAATAFRRELLYAGVVFAH